METNKEQNKETKKKCIVMEVWVVEEMLVLEQWEGQRKVNQPQGRPGNSGSWQTMDCGSNPACCLFFSSVCAKNGLHKMK